MKELIVFLSPIHWNHVFQRPQHLALAFSKNRTVLFVSNSTKNYGWLSKARLNEIYPNLFELFPPKIGPNSSAGQFLAASQHDKKKHKLANAIIMLSRFIYSANYIIDGLYIRYLKAKFKPERLIIWVSSPAYLFSIPLIGKSNLLVYDRLDDFANMPGFGKETKFFDLLLTKKADIVFSSSKKLNEIARMHSKKPVILRNAVEYDHFAVNSEKVDCPADLVSIPQPRICYIGVIGDWVNLEMVKEVAVSHPHWHFVFIGPNRLKTDFLNIQNIHFLGKKPYSLLPQYLANVNICLVPFKINALTNCVNPVKIYEYLAAGKPIISTRISESIILKDYLTLIDTTTELGNAIQMILNNTDDSKIKKGQFFAKSNDWKNRVKFVEDIFSESK